jgi:hypothetical protein
LQAATALQENNECGNHECATPKLEHIACSDYYNNLSYSITSFSICEKSTATTIVMDVEENNTIVKLVGSAAAEEEFVEWTVKTKPVSHHDCNN